MKINLLNLTRSLASGVALAWITARKVLTNLYILNNKETDLPLIYDGDFPIIYPQAYREYLDRLGDMFGLSRLPGEGDDDFRIRILFVLRQNSTKSGLVESLRMLFSSAMMEVDVEVRESFVEIFDGVTSSFASPMRSHKNSLLYGVTIYVTPITENLTSVIKPGEAEATELPTGDAFNRVGNNYYRLLLDIFQVSSFTELLWGNVASGVKINKVILVEPGAGGSRYRTI